MTMDCLGEAFASTKDPVSIATWAKIDKFVNDNGVEGEFLVESLQNLGWKILYWNPDPSKNLIWDKEDPTLIAGKPVKWDSGVKNDAGQFVYSSSWGQHEEFYRVVMKFGKYYTTPVDDAELLVGFKTTPPQQFLNIPFFVGVAHAGYHVFPGFYGQVIEAHSARRLDSIDNMQTSPFNPLAAGGGPRWTPVEKYRSGMMAVPPGSVE
jgi:hypothetical protein